MHLGHYISGAGHLVLLGWLAFGDVFASDPLPMEVREVSLISGAEFAAMMAAQPAPQSLDAVVQPASPDAIPEAPEVSAGIDAAPQQQSQPAPAATPAGETPPDTSQITPLPPRAEVSDAAPVLPEPPSDLAVLAPSISDRAQERPADRVAPDPVAPPDPEARADPDTREAVTPDATGDVPRETAPATAPDAATREIVTEADTPASAPLSSRRPPARRPDPPAEPPVETARETPAEPPQPAAEPDPVPRDAVADALAEALAGQPTPSNAPATPQGPPLTAGEREALRVAVSDCWNVGALSTDALRTTVVVAVSMTPDAKPVIASIRLASSSGGNDAAASQAFEAARRAIIRCGARGFDLPAEKYGQWQEIEMTFNPERMRAK